MVQIFEMIDFKIPVNENQKRYQDQKLWKTRLETLLQGADTGYAWK
jgi:hypothetical protein